MESILGAMEGVEGTHTTIYTCRTDRKVTDSSIYLILLPFVFFSPVLILITCHVHRAAEKIRTHMHMSSMTIELLHGRFRNSLRKNTSRTHKAFIRPPDPILSLIIILRKRSFVLFLLACNNIADSIFSFSFTKSFMSALEADEMLNSHNKQLYNTARRSSTSYI
jgi:hypothetical protein